MEGGDEESVVGGEVRMARLTGAAVEGQLSCSLHDRCILHLHAVQGRVLPGAATHALHPGLGSVEVNAAASGDPVGAHWDRWTPRAREGAGQKALLRQALEHHSLDSILAILSLLRT